MIRFAQQWRLILAGLLGVALGGAAISQTSEMSELGRVFPFTASLISIAAGCGVVVQAILRPRIAATDSERIDYLRAILFAATMLIWALSLDVIGFVPGSGIAVVVVAMIARREPMSSVGIVTHAAAGVVLVLGFSLLLSEVLNVRLP